MKQKVALVLVPLLLGWLSTAAIAEDETPAASAESPVSASEPAAATEQSTDKAAVDSSTGDVNNAASPAETEAK